MNEIEKRAKMKELIEKWEKIKTNSIADMFLSTNESSDAFSEMWDFAKENGFVDKNGSMSLDCEKLVIYKNYGCLAAEKINVYTYSAPEASAKCYDRIVVKIPDGWETFENYMGETILTAPWGKNYTVHSVLGGNEYPYFRTFGNGENICLDVIEVIEC